MIDLFCVPIRETSTQGKFSEFRTFHDRERHNNVKTINFQSDVQQFDCLSKVQLVMSDSLTLLRKDIVKKGKPVLVKGENADSPVTEDINEATHLKLQNGTILDLNQDTIFEIETKPISLKVAAYCWFNQDLSAAEFLADSQSKNVQTLTFLQRTDLITWLKGDSDESEFISKKSEAEEEGKPAGDDKMEVDDPFLEQILNNERHLIDHNTALRGFKAVDFSNVGRECEIKIVKVLKRKGGSTAPSSKSSTNTAGPPEKKRRQNPIILISPAASALISIANIKPFFDESTFLDPNSADPKVQELLNYGGDIRNVSHTFPRIGKQTFLIVNNTDKFTKAEYWDRVVAIFTTGQQWQFKSYKWSDPQQLFQKIKGYFFHYNGDIIPSQVNDWNVEKIGLDKSKRFKDAQVLNHFWDSLEKSMIARGWSS